MRGFMCHSSTATAVCMANDPRSVVLPRRPRSAPADRNINLIDDHTRLMNNNNAKHYSRFTRNDSHSSSSSSRSSTFLPSIKSQQDFNPQEPKPQNHLIGKPPPPVTSSDHVFQVVVMRVSLHCQGCAGKLKKHLSKMEGVTSFSIDLETKRVTVMGHVSPTGVLESISKVRRAEFWPS